MASGVEDVQLSALEAQRFGIRTARASWITADTLNSVIDFCKDNDVVLLIARTPASDLGTAQAMEREGFSLMDTLIYYSCDFTKTPIPPHEGKIGVVPIRPGEERDVESVATASFQGYRGHYHADERLDPEQCDRAYTEWAVRSCLDRQVANEVLVAHLDGSVVGFGTMRLNDSEEGEGVLFGVDPSVHGRGVYRSLMIHGMRWCLSNGAERMVVSTQITNLAVQKVWTRLGFEPSGACYTFHKWFGSP